MRAVSLAMLAVASCGDGVAGPDASVAPDARDGLVSLTYRGVPSPVGWPVYFQNADSSLVLATRTDGSGKANAFMNGGGFVTIIASHTDTRFLFTFADVQPGDELVVDESGVSGPETIFDLRIAADPDASLYFLEADCGSQNVSSAIFQPVQVRLHNCQQLTDMLVLSFGNERRYQFRKDVPLPPIATLALTDVYHPYVQSPVTATNVPAQITRFVATKELVGQSRALFSTSQLLAPIAGEATTTIELPLPANGTAMTRFEAESASGLSVHDVTVWGPAQRTDVVDYAAVRLPEYLETPRYEPATHSLVWKETDTGTLPDAVFAEFGWDPSLDDLYQWHVLAPRKAAPSIQLPVLPDPELAPHGVVMTPFTFVNIAAEGGFDRIRSRPLLGAWLPSLTWPIDRAEGRVDYQTLRLDLPP